MILKMLTIAGLANLYFWASVPAGLAAKLSAFLSGLATAIGAEVGLLIVVIFGNQIQQWMQKKFSSFVAKMKSGKAFEIWEKYGVIGLGFLAPLTVGFWQAGIIELILGAKPGKVIFWFTIGILVWTTGFTLILAAGVSGIGSLVKSG